MFTHAINLINAELQKEYSLYGGVNAHPHSTHLISCIAQSLVSRSITVYEMQYRDTPRKLIAAFSYLGHKHQ